MASVAKFLFLPTCLATLSNSAESARILAINPMPYFSHQYFYRPVWRELAARGHEIVLISAAPMADTHPNISIVDISFIREMLPNAHYMTGYVEQISSYYELMLEMAEAHLSSQPMQDLIHDPDERFDLVVAEFMCPVLYSFKKRFNAPMVIMSPLDIYNYYVESSGSPSHDLLYAWFRHIQPDPSFLHRVKSFVAKLHDAWYMPSFVERIDAISSKYFGRHFLPFEEALQTYDLLMINVNMALHEVRPLSPAVITLAGGMFLEATKNDTLPKDLKNLLDDSNEGVIYISFGTYVQSAFMAPTIITKLTDALSSLPYKILWKSSPFPEDILRAVNKTGKLHIRQWLPQVRVLEHRNVKLFINQGGIQSLEEAIVLKKPTIVFPLVADQHPNAYRMNLLHLGANLNINTATSSEIRRTIEDVISDSGMMRNLEKYSHLLQDQPMKPKDRAVWWLEYVIRNKGARHLRAAVLPWWQYVYLDVISFLTAIFIASTFLLCKLLIFTRRLTTRNAKDKME